MVTHSSILAWRIQWREEPGGLQSMRLQRGGKTERLSMRACMHAHTHTHTAHTHTQSSHRGTTDVSADPVTLPPGTGLVSGRCSSGPSTKFIQFSKHLLSAYCGQVSPWLNCPGRRKDYTGQAGVNFPSGELASLNELKISLYIHPDTHWKLASSETGAKLCRVKTCL